MGCDCHPYAEIRGARGKWTFLKKIYYDDPDPALDAFKERNYRLFGILAGVRNRNYPSLFEGRGLPEDSCKEIKQEFDEGDYHSATHFMVQELLDINWDAEAGTTTVDLDPVTYLQWVDGGRKGNPESLTIGGHDFEVSEEEMILLLAGGLKTRRTGRTDPSRLSKLKPLQYVSVQSRISYRDVVPRFVNEIIPALVRLGDPQKVRIVIGFDS